MMLTHIVNVLCLLKPGTIECHLLPFQVPHCNVYFSSKRRRQVEINYSGNQHNTTNVVKDDLSS